MFEANHLLEVGYLSLCVSVGKIDEMEKNEVRNVIIYTTFHFLIIF